MSKHSSRKEDVSKKNYIVYFIVLFIAIIVFILDRLSKWLIIQNIQDGQSIPFIPYVYLTHTSNTGIAFSMFTNLGAFLPWISLVVFGFIIYSFVGMQKTKLAIIGMGFIIGGAFGNIFDRIFQGRVTDFIDLRFFPIFNFADSFISIGISLLLLEAILEELAKIKKK